MTSVRIKPNQRQKGLKICQLRMVNMSGTSAKCSDLMRLLEGNLVAAVEAHDRFDVIGGLVPVGEIASPGLA